MVEPTDVPKATVRHMRRICTALPEVIEQGGSGRYVFKTGRRTFVNLIAVPDPAGGTVTVMSARVPASEQEALLAVGHPFFQPRSANAQDWIGMVIDDETDWGEVAEVVTDSFALVAAKRLVAQLQLDVGPDT